MEDRVKRLTELANELRVDILAMLVKSQSGHPGGSLSVIDVMTALYFEIAKIRKGDPNWVDRDRVVLSKGHVTPALFSVFAKLGFIEKKELMTFRQINSRLQGHPDKKCPGVEVATGSLGHGLSMANGMAIGLKMDGKPNRVFAILGDGEIQEGQVWEAAMAAAHYKLDNLIAVVDHNRLQIDGWVESVMTVSPVDEKFRAFGWEVLTIDGHDMNQILEAFEYALTIKNRPTVIVAHTVKGKGVSFMENQAKFHGTAPKMDEFKKALEEWNITNFDFSIFE